MKSGICIGLVFIFMIALSAVVLNDAMQRSSQIISGVDREHESLAKGRLACEALPLYNSSLKGDLTFGSRPTVWMNDYNSFISATRGRSVHYGELVVSFFPLMYGYAYYTLQENATTVYVCRAQVSG